MYDYGIRNHQTVHTDNAYFLYQDRSLGRKYFYSVIYCFIRGKQSFISKFTVTMTDRSASYAGEKTDCFNQGCGSGSG